MTLNLSDDTVNALEMSSAKQCFDDWLASIKQQDHRVSRTERKVKITDNTWRAFQLLEEVISSASGQINFG